MTDVWKEPTDEQNEHCILASHELIETANRLAREGIDPRVIIAALGLAAADMITSVFGSTAVVPWFEGQAKILRELQQLN